MATKLWASRAASNLRISTFHRAFALAKDLKYVESHEWVKVDGSSATIGITDHAQNHLGDVVYVELPEAGVSVKQFDSFGAVESVKATSDINSPVSGKVVEVNEKLDSSPALSRLTRIWHVENCPVLSGYDHNIDVYISSQQCIYSPRLVSGAFAEFGQINGSPYQDGWIIKVEMDNPDELKSLMDPDQYSKFCDEEGAKH